jgi:hypothetical protein
MFGYLSSTAMRRIPREIRAALIGGMLSGIAGALVFAVAHAMVIVPIWNRMGSGLLFGAVAGTRSPSPSLAVGAGMVDDDPPPRCFGRRRCRTPTRRCDGGACAGWP